jgi:hypothetical protein
VLQMCGQDEPMPFDQISTMPGCTSVYGEVFMYTSTVEESIVLKIIPIAGPILVNDVPQKSFEEMIKKTTSPSSITTTQRSSKNLKTTSSSRWLTPFKTYKSTIRKRQTGLFSTNLSTSICTGAISCWCKQMRKLPPLC